jgi:predicted amino acid-binding ACT domain protein
MSEVDRNRYVISLVVPDQSGILRDLTAAVTDLDANIDSISQTVVAGYFTTLLTAAFSSGTDASTIRKAIIARLQKAGAELIVTPCRPDPSREPRVGDRYVATLHGADRKGILKALTAFMAEREINIEDWYVTFEGDQVTHVAELTIPAKLDIAQIQADLRIAVEPFSLTSCLHHENVFRAMQEITPIKSLLQGVH